VGGRGVRFYITTGVTVAALTLAALASVSAGSLHGSARAWWIAINLLSVATAVVVQAVEQRRRERERQAAEVVAIDMRTAMNDSLDPIVRQIGRIAVTSNTKDRIALREQTVPMVLYSASLLIGPDRVRACWFRLDEGKPRALRPELSEGRAGGPRTTFVERTPVGEPVFELLASNEHRFCADVLVAPPPGWDPTHSHDYRTFLSVPVVAGSRAFGLLTVDSLLPCDLT
jgi:hypothetical protein